MHTYVYLHSKIRVPNFRNSWCLSAFLGAFEVQYRKTGAAPGRSVSIDFSEKDPGERSLSKNRSHLQAFAHDLNTPTHIKSTIVVSFLKPGMIPTSLGTSFSVLDPQNTPAKLKMILIHTYNFLEVENLLS